MGHCRGGGSRAIRRAFGRTSVPDSEERDDLAARRRVVPRPRQRGRYPHLPVPLRRPRLPPPRLPPPHRHRCDLGGAVPSWIRPDTASRRAASSFRRRDVPGDLDAATDAALVVVWATRMTGVDVSGPASMDGCDVMGFWNSLTVMFGPLGGPGWPSFEQNVAQLLIFVHV